MRGGVHEVCFGDGFGGEEGWVVVVAEVLVEVDRVIGVADEGLESVGGEVEGGDVGVKLAE